MAYPKKTPLDELTKCPPFLAHALARTRSRRTPLAVIVARSRLSERTYLRTARKRSWNGVKLDVIVAFLYGTQVNPWRMRNHWRWLRRHNFKFPYLRKPQESILQELSAANLKELGGQTSNESNRKALKATS
jgi:hypothetical protein